MAIQVTLDLPIRLMERLARASNDSDRSIQQVILDALCDADLSVPMSREMTSRERFQLALREIAEPWTDEHDALMAQVFPGDENEPIPPHEEVRARMPVFVPPLSKTLGELREDRV